SPLPDRGDASADDTDGPRHIREGLAYRFQPTRLGDGVVIEEGDVPAVCRTPTAVAGDAKAHLLLANVADGGDGLKGADRFRRMVARSIVDDDDLVVPPRKVLIDDAGDRLCQEVGAIARADDHGNDGLGGAHDVAPLSRQPGRIPLAARNFRRRFTTVRDPLPGWIAPFPSYRRV